VGRGESVCTDTMRDQTSEKRFPDRFWSVKSV
jgi:hypothetical protein